VTLPHLHRRLTAWIALMAMLLGTLAPTISHALARTGDGIWVQVCTPEGSRWVHVGDDAPSDPTAPLQPLEHCPYCSVHAPALGMPPAPCTLALDAPPLAERPMAWWQAPTTAHAWSSAQPRAPPSFA